MTTHTRNSANLCIKKSPFIVPLPAKKTCPLLNIRLQSAADIGCNWPIAVGCRALSDLPVSKVRSLHITLDAPAAGRKAAIRVSSDLCSCATASAAATIGAVLTEITSFQVFPTR